MPSICKNISTRIWQKCKKQTFYSHGFIVGSSLENYTKKIQKKNQNLDIEWRTYSKNLLCKRKQIHQIAKFYGNLLFASSSKDNVLTWSLLHRGLKSTPHESITYSLVAIIQHLIICHPWVCDTFLRYWIL